MTSKPALLTTTWLTILFASNLQAQTQSPVWLRYTVKGEEFSVTLPALPAMSTNKVFVERIKKQRVERLLIVSADGVVYSIYAFENPKPRQSLEEFIAEQAAKTAIDQRTERTVTVSNLPGKQYVSSDKAQPVIDQFFATKGRLYRFVAKGAVPEHPGVKQFFSSITFGEKQQAIAVTDGPGGSYEPISGERIFTGKDLDRRPRVLEKPEPSYTHDAKTGQAVGTVVLRVVFAANGTVTNIRVVQGLPYGLTEKAIDAAKKIKFIPAMKDGKNVSMWMQLEYHFNLY